MRVPRDIVRAIRKNQRFLIASHVRPDGDAIGSQLALYQVLQRLGKKAVIQNPSPVPVNFRFLPQAKRIHPFGPLPFAVEAAFVLDSPALMRLGRVREHVERAPLIINIDHHVSNEMLGHLNWVMPGTSSVGEMIFHLARGLKVRITRPIALCLYVALLTDMGKFQFMVTPRDGARIFRLAAALTATGLIPYEIYKLVYNLYSAAQLRLLGETLHTIRFAAAGQIAYLTVTRDMIDRYGLGEDSTDSLIASPRDLRSTRVAILFTEGRGRVKVSLRSKEPSLLNMNRVAARFGGGGHPAAAGAELKGALREVRPKILKAVCRELEQAGRRSDRPW